MEKKKPNQRKFTEIHCKGPWASPQRGHTAEKRWASIKVVEGRTESYFMCHVCGLYVWRDTDILVICSGIRCLCRTPLVARDQAPCSYRLAVKICENVFIFELNLYSSNLMFYNMYLSSSKCMWHIYVYIYYITYICYILRSELFYFGRKIRQVYTN